MLLLQALQVHSFSCGWEDILRIPIRLGGHALNLFTHYDQLSEECIHEHAWTYHGNCDRQAQAAHQLFECLQVSITSKACLKVIHDPQK